jgi:hypothetical protein
MRIAGMLRSGCHLRIFGEKGKHDVAILDRLTDAGRRAAVRTSVQPLLDDGQCDQALRDLMPIVEWLKKADRAMAEGALKTRQGDLESALAALQAIPAKSPAIKAYARWLEQNRLTRIAGPG